MYFNFGSRVINLNIYIPHNQISRNRFLQQRAGYHLSYSKRKACKKTTTKKNKRTHKNNKKKTGNSNGLQA